MSRALLVTGGCGYLGSQVAVGGAWPSPRPSRDRLPTTSASRTVRLPGVVLRGG